MITLETRKIVFDTICNGIRYWISFENSNCAASFIYMSSQLPLSGFERSSLARLIQIFDAVFPNTPYESLTNTLHSANIPDKYQLNVETAFSYVMLQMVINFLNAKLFSEVITFLVTAFRTIASVHNPCLYHFLIFSYISLYLQNLRITCHHS